MSEDRKQLPAEERVKIYLSLSLSHVFNVAIDCILLTHPNGGLAVNPPWARYW